MQRLFTRNFIFITIGQAVSMFGTAILKFAVSLYILDLTGSAAILGTVTAISSIPPIFLSPLGGVLADRKNKRNMMVALDFTYGLIAVVLGSVLIMGHTSSAVKDYDGSFVLIICCVSIFLTASIVGMFLMSAIKKKLPANMLGRVMSFYMTIANCVLPIGWIFRKTNLFRTGYLGD